MREDIEIRVAKLTFAFMFGAGVYSIIEILYRGYTHPSMTITGGICCVAVYCFAISKIGYLKSAVLSAVFITLSELCVGLLVNRILGLNVWDYSHHKFNIMGQICPLFSAIWLILSMISIPLCRYMDKKLFFYNF
ncbi:MAG: hypothetical protein E7675_05970 [Ruminococcaceae bacterium]|nr:hypothetical protein [Oscillospiraceae bacterium]